MSSYKWVFKYKYVHAWIVVSKVLTLPSRWPKWVDHIEKINNLNFISCLLLARVYTVGPIVSLSAAVNRCCSMYHLGATVSVLPSLTDVTLLSTTTLKQLQLQSVCAKMKCSVTSILQCYTGTLAYTSQLLKFKLCLSAYNRCHPF